MGSTSNMPVVIVSPSNLHDTSCVSGVSHLDNVSNATRVNCSSPLEAAAHLTSPSSLDATLVSRALTEGLEDMLTYFPANPLSSPLAYLWIWMTASFSHVAIATFVPIIIHEVLYVFSVLPTFIFQFIPYMRKFKIQGNHPETASNQWLAFKLVIFNHMCTQVPQMFMPPSFEKFYCIPCDWDSMPRWYVLAAQVYFCAMCEDTWHYFLHLLFHSKHLYKRFHKMHHTFQAPFGLTAEYSHPLEVFVLGSGFFIGLFFVCNHMATMFAWIMFRVMVNIDAHCGYDVPFNPLHLIPFYAGARYHDYHHSHNNANFSAIFTWWDWLFGTDKPYKRHLARLEAAKRGKER